MRPGLAVLVCALCILSGCAVGGALSCKDHWECSRTGQAEGSCVRGHCAMVADDCASGLRWDATAPAGDAGECVAEALSQPLADGAASVVPCAKAAGRERLGESCGPCDEGAYACVEETVRCVGGRALELPIDFGEGEPGSEGAQPGSSANLAVDGLPDTAWQVHPGRSHGVWEWTGHRRECFVELLVVPTRNQDRRFDRLDVLVLDADGRVTSSGRRLQDTAPGVWAYELINPTTGKVGVWGARMSFRLAAPGCANCGISEVHGFVARPSNH